MMAASSSGAPEVGEISRHGLTQVYSPIGGGKVDIVFVHGLNGNPEKTWTSEKTKVFWPSHLLPPILEEEKARILVYGYDADVTSFTDGVSKDKIHNHAENLVAALSANRRMRKANERSIIFVAHSLGGLVVKRALIYSEGIRGNHTQHLRSIFVSTYGILFLGTPHKGSDIAKWGSVLESICRGVMPSGIVDSNPNLVNALKRENETLQTIDRDFIQLMSRFYVYFFHEGKPTHLGKMKADFVVDEESASPNLQDVERSVIQQDHSHMCKFENDAAPGFDLVAEALQRYAGDAPDKVEGYWKQEKEEREVNKKAQIQSILPGSVIGTPDTGSTSTNNNTPETSQILPPRPPPQTESKDTASNTDAQETKAPDPYFIVPPGFRDNTFFVGMDAEYQELGRLLFDKRRQAGTACVLLWGQPGGGKSHLAREYVTKNRKKFSGGVFWITSKTKEEMYHAYWNIWQKVVCKDAPEMCESSIGRNIGKEFVPIVKDWLQSRSEWIIVFDGVNLEKDADATELNKFVPDSKDSSLIYISRAKNLETKQRLLRPHPIKVGPLKEEDGVKLLFKSMHKKKVSDADRTKAAELVRRVGGLPLAIDAISKRLADFHEPLAKFKLDYSNTPSLEHTYKRIFDDLLNKELNEAWNLISILCWFGQNIPVEMVHLGQRILKAEHVEVRSAEMSGQADISNTLAILMRYALIERNEPESDKDSMSSSRSSLNEPDPIDMLKIHSVVQSFCCDSLNSQGLLPKWLGHAVSLFSFSYQQADLKINKRPEPGRVSDYRYYLIHGQRLWDHTETYGKTQNLGGLQRKLGVTLDLINREIQSREPNSSQESLREGIFQISIFDRTSSSSGSSMPSAPGPTTPPSPHPTPPPLDGQNMFGLPVGKEIDSPASLGTASPGIRPKIADLSPGISPLGYEDVGYDSDREGQPTSQAMRPNLSTDTARPSPRSRAPTTDSQQGWQVVPSRQKSRRQQPRGRRDLGSFRRAPTRSQPVQTVNRDSVTGSMGLITQDGTQQRRRSSPASDALREVQARSPTHSARNSIGNLFQRIPFTSRRPPTPTHEKTWASVAAGALLPLPQPPMPTPPGSGRTQPIPAPTSAARDRSRESIRREGQSNIPSPLATEFIPHRASNTAVMEENQRFAHGGDWTLYSSDDQEDDQPPTTARRIPTSFQGYPSIDQPAYPVPFNDALPRQQYQQQQAPYPSPNPAPLPIETNITITPKRPRSPEYISPPTATHHGSLPNNYYLPPTGPHYPRQTQHYSLPPSHRTSPTAPLFPTGYTSQPMSRDTSHQSHASIAETEPPPHLSPPSPLPYTYPQPGSYTDPTTYLTRFSTSPARGRERGPDGRPVRKSPKTEYTTYYQPPPPGPPPIPPYADDGPAGWSSMSRSSSGPGIALQSSQGDGLGIVGFGAATAPERRGEVQFGGMPGVDLREAGRRRREHELRLEEEEEEEGRRRRRWEVEEGRIGVGAGGGRVGGEGRGRRRRNTAAPPYPDTNVIPSASDPVMLGRMMGEGGVLPR